MASNNNISVAQQAALIDFLEGHQELALGHFNRSKEGRSLSKRLWNTCADILNSNSANCSSKTGEKWRSYYNDYKCKLLRKIRLEKSERSATGGGSAKPFILTPLQERLYNILGKDVGEPLPGVRHNPLEQVEGTADSGSAGANHNNNDIILDLNEDQVVVPDGRDYNVELIGFESLLEQNHSAASETHQQEQHREEDQPRSPRHSGRRRQRASRRGRRQRSPRRQSPRQNAEENDSDPTMRDAADRLERMERLNADALLVHAQAVNRLAAAMETIAERLPPYTSPYYSPPPMPMTARRRRRLVIGSDSDED